MKKLFLRLASRVGLNISHRWWLALLCPLMLAGGLLWLARAPHAGVAAQGSADTVKLSEGVQRQLKALLDEKAARTPAQQKLDSQLLYALKMRRGEEIAPGIRQLSVRVETDAKARTVVDITAIVGGTLLEDIEALGAEIISVHAQYNSIRASAPLDRLEEIAALPQVRFIQPKQEPQYLRHVTRERERGVETGEELPPGFLVRANRVRSFLNEALDRLLPQQQIGVRQINNATFAGGKTSEGDVTHRAAAARAMFGANGAGVRIGVLSDGVVSLGDSQASGDLPSSVVVLSAPGPVAGDEGTAMLEIINDLAPGAQLYFATAQGNAASFAQAIRDLRAAGCDIIVDDIQYDVETPFQDGQAPGVVATTNGGVIAQAVNDVTASGALYFTSAGNQGNKDKNTSGVWAGDFVDGGALALVPGGTVHNFGGGTQFDTITATSSRPIATLFWADPLGGSNNDYDLFVLNNTGSSIVASSTNVQNGTQDPFELLNTGIATNNRLVILKKTSAANRFLHLQNYRGRLNVSTEGQVHGHGCGANAFSVAATPAGTAIGAAPNPTGPFPNPFNSSNTIELFSSDGPRRIFFNANGTPITPGNFSSTGGLLRQKPDITAADGVLVSGAGGFGATIGGNKFFFGTSAAAPHAAAIAALLKSANPALTPAQIRNALTSTAIDIEGAGVDRNSGAGIIMAFQALQAIGATPSPNLQIGTVTATPVGGNSNTVIEPGESAQLNVQLLNTGVNDASNITATLTSATPGVTITQGNASYPNLAFATGAAVNATPFTFALSTSAICPLRVEFVLNVNFAGGGSPRALKFSVPTGPPPVVITSRLDSTAPTSGPGFTATTGLQLARLNRSGAFSLCGVNAPCPGALAGGTGTRRYDAYSFSTCPASTPACITVTLNTPCRASASAIFATAYLGNNFSSGSLCANYLADMGFDSSGASPASFTFNVPSGASFTIVVNEVNDGGGLNCNYSLNVTGLCCQQTSLCPAPANVSPASSGPGTNVTITGANFTGVTGVRFANDAAAAFTVVSDSEISATVPSGAVNGPLTISRPGCPDAQTPAFTVLACPTITTLSPIFGAVGTSVVITGTNFTGTSAVKFANNVPASFTINSDTQITATVPAGTVTGPITLSRSGCSDAQTTAFTVQQGACTGAAVELKVDDGSFETAIGLTNGGTDTAVNRLTPASYPATLNGLAIFWPNGAGIQAGTSLTLLVGNNSSGGTNINGLNFQTVAATVQALGQFNFYSVPPLTINAGDFVVGFRLTHGANVFPIATDLTAPSQRRSYVSSDGSTYTIIDDVSASLAGDFGIRAELQGTTATCCPVVSGLNPTTGGVGTQVTITGANFTGVTAVKFANNVTANFTIVNDTTITTTVPSGAVNGPITVSKPNCADAQTATFTLPIICPTVSSFNPASGTSGTSVTINGTGFTGITGVRFTNGLNASFTVNSDTQITATVPSGVISGPIRISKTGCAEVQTANFTVCSPITITPASLPAGTLARFDFAVDWLQVDGNIHGGGNPDGTPEFLDNFDDGLTNVFPTSEIFSFSPKVESGGFLRLLSDEVNIFTPGFLTNNNFLGQAEGSLYRLQKGGKNSNITASFRADVPLPSQFYGLQLIRFGTNELVNIQVGRAGSDTVVIALARPESGPIISQSVPVNLIGINRIILRLSYDDSTSRVTHSFSTDGGNTFTTITLPQPGTVMTTTGSQGIVSIFGSVATYNQMLTASGGTPDYKFKVTAGALPGGLTLMESGQLSGAPNQVGKFNFTVTATDANGCTGTREYSLDINCPTITLLPTTLPGSTIGTAYNQTISVSPSGTNTFSVTAGSLPAGLSLNSTTGAITGTPTTAGTANFTITALGAGGCSGSQAYTLTINNPAPTIASLNPNAATAGSSALTLTVTGSNFVSGSTVRWNGADRPTTFVSATQLTALIPATDLAISGTASVTVFNSAPGGGTSNAATFTINNPLPALASLNPSSATAGGQGFTLTLNGSNFVNGAVVQWNGSNRATTFVNATQLTAAISAADIATAGTATVTIVNPVPGGGTSNALSFTVNNPVPTLASINPNFANTGGAAFALLVTGTNFLSNSVVQWNGSNRPTTFVSATQLTAQIPASDLATAGTANVTVFNPAPGGGTSTAQTFSINNPAPMLTALNPNAATAGGAGFTLFVTGTNFVNGALVRWNGSDRATTFVSSTQLTAAITAADIATVGAGAVTVFNPAPGGGTSNTLTFTINNPAPTLTSLTPNSALALGAAFTLTLTGANFVNGSVVRWNGADRPTTFVSSTQLTTAIPASDIATAGTANLTVFNPAPGGGLSNAQSFNINNPVPTTTSLNSNSAVAGSAGFTLTVTGTNFVSGAVVRWNGADRATTFIDSTHVTAVIPASDLVTAGTASVTVFNPAPGGGLSNAQSFTVNNPLPALTQLNPNSATAGGAAFTLTVTGTNFVNGAVVRWNGSDRPTTFVSSTQLTAAITAADIATAGASAVTVFNPAPGGGVSSALSFTINSPVPTLTGLNPNNANVGGAAFTLTVTGTNFVNGAVVRWNGADRPTTFVSATQLTAAIPASDLATAGTASVTVFNPTPGGGTANAATFTINNPLPALASSTPSSATAGGQGFTLTLNGANFVNGAVVQWNGSNRATTFVNATQLTAAVTAADIATAGTATVTVVNPVPGGGTSNALSFTVNNLAPSIASLTPSVVTAGSAAFTLTVNGANFVNDSVVRWNGNNRATTFVSATRLTAVIPASDIATAGVARVTVSNPAPGGGTSNELTITIAGVVTSVSAASFLGAELAAESIVSAFGLGLATSIAVADTTPLPTTLAGTTVKVRDSAGVERLAPLFFVAPTQINYLLPPGTAAGTATITVTSGNGTLSVGTVQIAPVAPGLFTANANGQGIPAAVVFRLKANGEQSTEPVAQFDSATGRFVATPIDLGPEGEQVFLILFGTGFRAVSSLTNATARIGGTNAEVLFAGAQGLAGLDQANLRIPRSLAGRGEVDVVLTVDGKAANTVRVNIK